MLSRPSATSGKTLTERGGVCVKGVMEGWEGGRDRGKRGVEEGSGGGEGRWDGAERRKSRRKEWRRERELW